MNIFHKKAFTRFFAFLLALTMIIGLAPCVSFARKATALPSSFYEQLLACTDAGSMLDLITENPDDSSALNNEELKTLTQTAESFPISDERTELLETLNVLSGSDTSENRNLLAAADGITVGVYNKEPSSPSAQLMTTLVSAGSGQIANTGDWPYSESRFFQIQVDGIPTDRTYELVITMQPVLMALSLPEPTGTTGHTFKANTLHANKIGTYSADEYGVYSGTIVYSLAADTAALAFALEVGYNLTIWDKLTGLLNYDTSAPLLSVYLRESGSEEKLNQQDLHQVNSSVAWPEHRDVSLGSLLTNSVTVYKDNPVILGLSRMVNDSYNNHFFYPKVVFEIGIPSYTHTDGNTYYLDCDTSELHLEPAYGDADFDIVVDDENHKITITLRNYYTRRNEHFSGIKFSLPADVATAIDGEKARRFTGTFSATQYPSVDAVDGKALTLKSGNTFEINYSTQRNSQLVLGGRPITASVKTPSAVKTLGSFSLGNTGSGDSGPLKVRIAFDSDQTNNIYVTTFNLMPDFASETIQVKYTLVDREGNVKKEGVYPLANPYYNAPPQDDKEMNRVHIRFTRNMLVENGEDYYLKTIEYTIANIPAGMRLYSTGGHKGDTCGGVFWGYVNENAADGTTATNTIQVASINGDGSETPLDNLTRTPKTTLTTNNASSYILNSGSVEGSSSVKEVAAGDRFKISGQFVITSYPYGYTSAVSKIRIGLMLPQGITFTAEDVSTSRGEAGKYNDIVVKAPTVENPLWVIELNDDVVIGGFTEDITKFDTNDRVSFSIYLNTEKSMQGQTLLLKNIMWAAADGQNDMLIGGSYQSQAAADPYNLNNYVGTDDYIASLPNDTAAGFTIVAAPVQLDISASIRDSSETTGDLHATTKDFTDHVTYDLQIDCNDGGTTEELSYLIPVPKTDSPINTEFVATRNVNMELRSEPKVNTTSGAPLKLLYTVEPSSTLTYDYAATTESIWVEADEITDWTAVTMIKVVSDDPIQTGSLGVVSAPFYYADDMDSYAQNAGQIVQFSSRGYYSHRKGSQLFAGVASTHVTTMALEYTLPEVQKITLVAAKDRNPKNDVDPWVTLNLDTQFVLEQNFSVNSIDLSNVNLVPSTSDFTTLNSNTDFGITVSVNTEASKDLSADISSENALALGTVDAENAISFKFEIFNGNALSDTITPRTVLLNIVGHNGVTIPVEITIKLEAAAVENATVSILPYREYLPFDGGTSVVISQGCTITAQFVVSGLIPDNYPTRTLSFDVAPTANTQILMIDWTNSTSPQYYYYNLNGTTSSIPLASFVPLVSDPLAPDQKYQDPTGTTEISKETLLFIVVFPNAQENSREITLTHAASQTSGVPDLSDSLNYSFTGAHTFTMTVPGSTVTAGESFNIGYSNTAPQNADSRYANKKLALVITSASGRLPVNARLLVDGTTYYLNSDGQFIIPLGPLSTSGTVSASKTMAFLSETQTGNITLQAQLYVSATANDAQPMAGESLLSRTFVVQPQVAPAFRVIQMSNRLFVLGKDDLNASLHYAFSNLTDCRVTLEVQKKSGNGYATDGYYLNMLNDVSATTVQLDVTALINSGNPLNMVFNDLQAGTYRVLFTINRDGMDPISIPYNFLVIN